MHLTHREAGSGDFEGVYRVCYRAFGYGDEHRGSVRHEWEALRAEPASFGLVVEDRDRPLGPGQTVAYQQISFVTEAFVRWARSGMPPYVNMHVTRPLPDGTRPMLRAGDENPADGTRILINYYGWDAPGLSADEARYVRDYLHRSFLTYHRGRLIREMLIEVSGDAARQMAANAGYRVVRDYSEHYDAAGERKPPPPHLWPYLMGVTREEALADEGSYISYVFAHAPPRLPLTAADKELLRLASRGVTDPEAAAALGVTEAAVKKRWLALYNRVREAQPGLLPEQAEPWDTTRGAEKRRILLRYVREHPGELRPF